MGHTALPFDLQRDAAKYKNLVRALDQATHAIRAMELAQIFDIDELLIRLLPNIAEALDAEQAFVAREDHALGDPQDDDHHLVLLARFPYDEETDGFLLDAEGIVLEVLESGRPRVKTSLGQPQKSRFVAGLELFQARSAVVVRMETQAVTYLVGVCNERNPERAPFLAADRMTLSYIVEMAAINARANERRQQELDAIQEIAEYSANRSLPELYGVIVRWAVQVTDARYAAIWQYRAGTSILHFEHAYHATIADWHPQQEILLIPADQAAAWIPHAQGNLFLHQKEDDLSLPWEDGVKMLFAVPLLVEKQLLGMLYIATDEPTTFTLDDQRFINHLAPHAAVALHTARQRENRERVIRLQQKISDVLPLKEQLEQIHQELHRYIDTSGLFIALLDERQQEIYFPLAYHHDQLAAEHNTVYDNRYARCRLGERNGMVEWVFARRTALLVPHYESWLERDQFVHERHSDLRSCLVVPFISKNKVLGAIGLRSYDPTTRFDEYDKRFVELLANHVATIIVNSQLYDQRVKELQAISRFQEKISVLSMTVEEEVQSIYQEASHALNTIGIHTDNMIVVLFNPDSKRLVFALVYDGGMPLSQEEREERDAFRTRTIEERADIYAWMLRSRQPLLGQTAAEIAGWHHRLDGVEIVPEFSKSWLGAPMIANDELVGLIILRHLAAEYAYEEEHCNLLKMIAAQAAIVIRNAEQANQLSRSNAVAIMGAWGADIVHDINREVGSIRRAVHILRHQKGVSERDQSYLQRIDESMNRLALPELPEAVPDPASRLDVRRAPSLRHVLQSELVLLKAQAADVELLWHFSFDGIKVAMHEQWLRRMVRHLVKNGIKAVRDAATLPKRVEIEVTITAKEALVRVIDTGKGVRPEIQKRLFRRDIPHSHERVGERAGRGLLLVGYIMEAHGGRAEMEWSEAGKGSCFLLGIPLTVEQPGDGRMNS